ncbi:MAG: beta-eliminating lyase-related protein [Pseudoruegeria sp.]
MQFASDNTAPVHPIVMSALQKANDGYAASYGADVLMADVVKRIRRIFEAPEADVYLVSTGTAANALILGTLAAPFSTIFCSRNAHIQEDECNAPEFYSGGAKLTLVNEAHAKISPEDLNAALNNEGNRHPHGPSLGALSISQATERGTIYSVQEIKALSALAKEANMPTHMDGARFANALVELNCSPADMSWRVGVDAVTFGGTKNGLMGVEAVIFFNPKHARDFELRRKRGGHLMSKHRFLSAQMLAYLTDDLWLNLATSANGTARMLLNGLTQGNRANIQSPVDVNMLFVDWDIETHDRLTTAGAQFSALPFDTEGRMSARLVTNWSTSESSIQEFLEILNK